ncbi:hypothetical protein GN958_ATG04613 [Phytophthora infestans]|uniref:Uncharacterized protein n=1 Tax=Phytophthora infestans TaxID=4787 RepID=A0A8S9V6J6_PHYIN|nr:hypothetical protein GN958_ATG04613 [Phytophthora infestans]
MPNFKVKRALLTEFGCKLSQLELSTKMQCFKREGDSWHDYLEYLNFIESLMKGDQTKIVMEGDGRKSGAQRKNRHRDRNHERNNRFNDHNGGGSHGNNGDYAAKPTPQQNNVVEQAKRMVSSSNDKIAAASEESELDKDSAHDSDAEAHVWMAAKATKQPCTMERGQSIEELLTIHAATAVSFSRWNQLTYPSELQTKISFRLQGEVVRKSL